MRAVWKKDKVISLELEENIYTIAQLVNPIAEMQFFAIFNKEDKWENIDLNQIDPLFCVSVGNVVMQRLGVRKLSNKEAKPKTGGFKHYFIKPGDNADGYRLRDEFMWSGGRLVDVGEDCEIDSYYAPTVIENLTVEEHRTEILTYEFSNMYGDNHAKERLLHFYNTGINRDMMKKMVFPELDTDETIPKVKMLKL